MSQSPRHGPAIWRGVYQKHRGKSMVTARMCPASEVRATSRHPLIRTSEAKGHKQTYYCSPVFEFKFPPRASRNRCRNFKSAALAKTASIIENPRYMPHFAARTDRSLAVQVHARARRLE